MGDLTQHFSGDANDGYQVQTANRSFHTKQSINALAENDSM
jgi:hypothetical protein